MHRAFAAWAAALILTVALLGTASAATTVDVRIEGKAETLFEGPVTTVPHGVRATSDKIPVGELRRCDGVNALDPENVVPGVTPTAVSADAMTLIGQTFDGQWYRSFEDYFVTRFGPDQQEPAAPGGGAYWGILVNDTFTDVGGCQYQLADDEVLWVFDAFHERPTLALFPEEAHYTSGPRQLYRLDVEPNEPVPLEVVAYEDNLEDNPPAEPSRTGSHPFGGAKVSPVITGADGSERVDPLIGPTTDADGKATVSFSEPGWHRIKATVGSPGAESTIRSNRLDICVKGTGGAELEGADECGELPAADRVRVAPPTVGEIVGPETEGAAPEATAPAPSPAAKTAVGSLRVRRPKLDRSQLAKGRVLVSWKVLDAGPGVRKWTISSLTVGVRHARWIARASGATKTRATVRLPRGATYRLRFAITDTLGATSTVSLGKVRVPKARPRRGR
ncbi:MAG TPA: hypothetical protein VHA76_09415 [Solirubrobacterales bacterium]|nr:hypothetical protein [Solirubrobacterales bacterium]